mmetsp:Transcript_21179/g.35016  ORF Transcript_21179/g.35016 Transcript_21179/m.35016 type:complete len:152 (-) Transcript_21179:2643-3098(-)
MEKRRKRRHPKESSSKPSDEEDENQGLSVFGYSCRIFRDDETARMIDEEKHLIPWYGQSDLLVDRFDVRGLLENRDLFKKRKIAYQPTAKEIEEEANLDQERYADIEPVIESTVDDPEELLTYLGKYRLSDFVDVLTSVVSYVDARNHGRH